MNILKATESYTLRWQVLWYVNYITIKKVEKAPLFHIPSWVRKFKEHQGVVTEVQETIFHKEWKQLEHSFEKQQAGGGISWVPGAPLARG